MTDFVGILTLIAGLGAVASLLANAGAWRRSHEQADQALQAAREPTVNQALVQSDLKRLGDYFFDTLGQLPLAEYADDAAAREVVSSAVRNVESFIDPDRFSSVAEQAEALLRVDTHRAEADAAMGDFWGGLSRLRRRIELSLRDVAATAGIPAERMGPNQLLRRLVRQEVVPANVANILRRAIDICNRGVHGEVVSGEEVEEAFALATDGLHAIRDI